MDGLITTFVIVTAGIAGNVARRSILVIGVTSLMADGVSMGVSEFLSVRGEASLQAAALSGGACFGAFAAAGSLPLVAYMASASTISRTVASIVTYALGICVVAVLRTRVFAVPSSHSFAEVVLLGALAAGVAAGVALATQSL